MRITFLLSAQRAALSLRRASVTSLLKPQAVNRPWFSMRNQTFFVSGKQSAVLFRVWPTMRFLCTVWYTSVYSYTHTPPPLHCHVEDNLASGNKYFWKTKWRQPNKKIHVQWEAPYPASSVFPSFPFTNAVKDSVINLLVSEGVVSLPTRGITQLCFNFTSYSTITWFAWEVSNLFF